MDDYQNYHESLTARELEVLGLMLEGHKNRDIATELVVEVGTVRWYTKQIYSKLGVHSRTEAVLLAQQLNLFGEEETTPSPSILAIADPPKLPTYGTAFVGRDQEIDELLQTLHDPSIRLITLAGPGGVGKTRLCVELTRLVQNNFADGVYFVSLLSAQSDAEILSAISSHLSIRVASFDQLLSYLKSKQMLLVLDNFEHLMESVPLVNRLVEETHAMQVIVTSRSSLNLRREWVRYLNGVSIPDHIDIDNFENYPAVVLFVKRAQLVQRDFSLEANREYVIKLCQLLHGLPLAIELAAAWLKSLTCGEIVEEIERDLDFLESQHYDTEERHSSLRIIFDQSWQMLTPKEQRIAAKLAVFRGGFGRKAAQQVTRASVQDLASLTDKSIIQHDGSGLMFMHELLRQYAEEQLVESYKEALGTKTTLMAAWRSLMMGDFENASALAENIAHAEHPKKPEEEATAFALMGILAGVNEDYARSSELTTAGVNLVQHQPDGQSIIAQSFCNISLAITKCGDGDYQLATEAITKAVQLASEMRIPAFIMLCLPVASIILAHEAEFEKAVQIAALAYTHPASTPTWMQNWRLLMDSLTAMRAELGDEEFGQAWDQGTKSSLDAVLEDVMDLLT